MSLIVKSGGSLDHKSGASFAVKSSAPPYIISGMEQSHWLVSDATVSGGRVTAVSDVSSVQTLTRAYGPEYGTTGGIYAAAGWELNGKTLPTFECDGTYATSFRADAWATKLSGYAGAFTTALLVAPSNLEYATWQWSMLLHHAASGYRKTAAPVQYKFSGEWMYQAVMAGGMGQFQTSQPRTYVPQLWITEYTGTDAATGAGQYRLWINGVEKTVSDNPNLNQTGTQGRETGAFNRFWIGGSTLGDGWFAGKFAQIHVWKSALSDTQRNDVTTYLMSISGIA